MNILVIGASGYIGAQLYAKAKQHWPCQGTASRAKEDLLALDLATAQSLDASLINQDTVLMLAAAISSPDICAKQPELAEAVNVTGTSALIELALARGAKVIFFSSDTVYGERFEAFAEDAPCEPVGAYGQMKYQVEQRFAQQANFKTIRLSYVFSSEDKFTRYVANCAKQGQAAEVFNSLARAVVWREDVVDGALALAQRWAEFPQAVFNFGGPQVLTRAAMAQQLRAQIWPQLQITEVEPAADFFQNRPRMINMQANLLPILLGRPARSFGDALRTEFS